MKNKQNLNVDDKETNKKIVGDFGMEEGAKQCWLQALRSGEYKQGFNFLESSTYENDNVFCSVDEYCCLGVLAKEAGVLKNGSFELGNKKLGSIETLSRGYGPNSKQSYQILPGKIQKHLVEMNDNHKSFEDIADWIEENL